MLIKNEHTFVNSGNFWEEPISVNFWNYPNPSIHSASSSSSSSLLLLLLLSVKLCRMSCAFPSPSFAQTIARLCASEQIPSTSTRNLTRTNLERGRKCGRAVESRVSRPQISSRTSVAANSCVCMSLSSPYPMAVNSEKAPILRPGEVEEVNIRVSARPYPVYIGCGIMCDTELLRR